MSVKKSIQKRKLIELLSLLSQDEMKAFDKYVQSPYFNNHKKVRDLVSYFRKYHPNYNITPQRVFKHIFGTKTFSEQLLNDVFNKCKSLLENFLAQQWFEQHDFLPAFALLNRLSEKKADWFFNKNQQKIQNLKRQQERKDVNYYQEMQQLMELELSYQLRQKNRTVTSRLQQQIDQQITATFIANKLRYYCALQNRRRNMTDKDWEIALLPEILIYLQSHPSIDTPLIIVWHLLALLLTHSTVENHYFDLKNYLEKNHTKLPKGELRQIYTAVITYCTQQARAGKTEYWQELLSCYELMLQEEVLIVEGYLQPPVHFQNIVSVALMLKKYTWASQFIQQYQDLLAPASKTSIVSFSKAYLHFAQQQYSDCITQLQAFALADDFNYISHKILLVKAYYEAEEYHVLFNLLIAFNAFLQNHKTEIPKNLFLAHKNFIKMTRKVLKFQEEKIIFSKTEQQSLQNKIVREIETANPVSQKAWLVEKGKELIK